jgi:transcriptional regulator with XRE-family HTH domain
LQKSIVSPDYRRFLALLRTARKDAGLTQAELAGRLGETQTFVSKCERGERRLDFIETRKILTALGVSFLDFINKLNSTERSEAA